MYNFNIYNNVLIRIISIKYIFNLIFIYLRNNFIIKNCYVILKNPRKVNAKFSDCDKVSLMFVLLKFSLINDL